MLKQFEKEGTTRFVLDNFPQNMNQAILFEKNVCNVAKLVFLELEENIIAHKMKESGLGENEIAQKLEEADEKLSPLIPYYQSFNKLIKQSANQKQVQIWNQIKGE